MIEVFYKITCFVGAITVFLAWLDSKYKDFINQDILFGMAFVLLVLLGTGFGITLIDATHFIYQLIKRVLE